MGYYFIYNFIVCVIRNFILPHGMICFLYDGVVILFVIGRSCFVICFVARSIARILQINIYEL